MQPRLLADTLARALTTRGWNVVLADPDGTAALTIITTDDDLAPSVYATGLDLAVRITSIADLEIVLARLPD